MNNIFKGNFKRIVAAMLSLFMAIGIIPVTALAAEDIIRMTFSYACQSDGSEIMYHGTFTSPSGAVSGGEGLHRVVIYGNGEVVYCIQPGIDIKHGNVLKANASETWNNLPEDQKNAIKTTLAFGHTGNSENLSGNEDTQIVATQMIIWEIVNEWRDPVTLKCTNSAIYNALCKDGWNAELAAVYKELDELVQKYPVMPDFADGGRYEMSYADGQYSLTLTDGNGVLNDCEISSSDSRISVQRSGNTLIFTSSQYIGSDVQISLRKETKVSAAAQLTAYGDPVIQDVIYGIAAPQAVKASLMIGMEGGALQIVKTSEDGIVSGIRMNISGNGINKTVETGDDGSITLEGMVPGIYTVTEEVAGHYEPQAPRNVEVHSGETAVVRFDNILRHGGLIVSKTSEDDVIEGMKFHLYGTSAAGQKVDLYAATDASGTASFENIPMAGDEGYTLEENDTADRYVVPTAQNVKVFWDAVTKTTFNNVLKKFNVTLNKIDAEHGTAQGDTSLAGASYGLYHDGELVDIYTTDINGNFTTSFYPCGSSWTIREISPSEGYLLDEREYSVGAEPANYTVEYNAAPEVTSYEHAISGKISIIKHSDDGSTQIETPEEGAVFEVYLTSARDYNSAREIERDVLVCDEDGFAISKELPYGLYTVHQISGKDVAEFMKDFTVFISEDGKTYKYLINNAPYSAYIKVVKADAESGETIPLTGAGFEIYDVSGNKITMSYTYPSPASIDTFYVNEDGYLITPEKLPAGDYTLVEVQAPYGYVLNSDPVRFTVSSDHDEESGSPAYITVIAYDTAQKGRITVSKSGEVFASVRKSGAKVPAYQAVFKQKKLSGAEFQVIAAENIFTGDGTLRVKAGTVVAELVTDARGIAETGDLYLGTYRVVETKAPYGMVLNTEEQYVTLRYAGQEKAVTLIGTGFVNIRQKMSMNAEKQLEQDDTFGIGMNGEIQAVSFGLYAKEELVAEDGTMIPKDGLIEIAFADETGSVCFGSDLPFGSYYVKELTTDEHYILDDTIYDVKFEFCGQEKALQTIVLNGEKVIRNELKYGRIEGFKYNDETAEGKENGLAGARFGLFKEGTMDLTAENAILTADSDENGRFAFENVPYGDYVIKELAAPDGYVQSDARYFVSITYDNQVIRLKVINYPIIGSVELTKVDHDYPDNHLTGAIFELYQDVDADEEVNTEMDLLLGELTEYEGGIYRGEGLRKGHYLVREKEAPEGFVRDDTVYAFEISEDGQVVVIENEAGIGFADQAVMGKIIIYKTDTKNNTKLVGAEFRICDLDGNAAAEGITGEDGTLSLELRYGKYTVAEIKAPEGYVLDGTPYSFEITEDGQEISIDMANTRITGKVVISKVDADTEKLLPNAGFRIYAADGVTIVKEGRTDQNGICEFELEFGHYYYQEFDAPEGYEIDDCLYEFSIAEDGKVISVVMPNQKNPEETIPETPVNGPDTGDNSNIIFWAVVFVIAMAGICVCREKYR